MEKGGKTYIATVVCGKPSVLQGTWQGEKSGVKLEIPSGVHGTIIGCIHTDPTPFLKIIPDSECFIAPTVEYSLLPNQIIEQSTSTTDMFRIVVPHIAKDENIQKSIVVRKGEIALAEQADFRKIRRVQDANDLLTNAIQEDTFFTVGKNNITICTRTFCQFTITSTEKTCDLSAVALIYGGIDQAGQNIFAKTRVFLCSPLYELYEYKLVSVCMFKYISGIPTKSTNLTFFWFVLCCFNI